MIAGFEIDAVNAQYYRLFGHITDRKFRLFRFLILFGD